MASELEVGKLKVAASDGAGGLVHENASGVQVGTDSNTTTGYIGTLSDHPLKLLVNDDGKVTIDTTGHVAIGDDKYFQWGGTNARIVGSHSGDYVKILTGNSAKLTVDSTGLCSFSGGINLGDTTLSNYKEGSWTPTATAGSIAGSNISYAGKYTRIGDTVHINLKISATANDLVIGSYVGISGLPFTVNETASGYYSTEDIELHHGGEANAGGTAVYLSAGGSATSTQNIYLSLTYYV